MGERGGLTPESRFALYAALLLGEEKRGGGGSSGRARRSLHLKIIGGYASQLRELAVLSGADRENLGTADSYVSWLKQNTPERGTALPSFLASEVPLFPRPTESTPITPGPDNTSSNTISGAVPVSATAASSPSSVPGNTISGAVPVSAPREPPYPPPSIRALGTNSERVAGSSGLEASGSLSVLPSGRNLPPQPPVPKAKTGVPPSTAPNVGPYLTLGQRATVISPNNPLLRVRSRSPPRSSSIPFGSAGSGVGPEREREAAEEILESAEEAAEESLDSGAAASSGVGPERATTGSGAGPDREGVEVPTSLKVAEGLLPPGTSVLLSLDIHLVADRDEAGTSACLERLLREHSELAVIFCSCAVKQKTIDKAVQCIHCICDRTIVRRPLTFPIFFTTSKTAPGTGKGAQLSKLADIFSRSRPAPLTFLYHVDDQDPICKNVTSYGHHGVHWAEEDPRALDQIVWELCWL
ncbi:unnamed protein product [Symbiodinium sp. CCMP2592]|nr:unnamed protein product [Symbiodinium sp. CCMP2592]